MPQFYFHLDDDRGRLIDLEGVELSDVAAAIQRALMVARDLLSEDILRGRVDLDARIAVVRSDGVAVHTLGFADAFDASRRDCSIHSLPEARAISR